MDISFRKILPHTLFGRSLLILVIPVLLIQLVTTYVFFDRSWAKMTDRLAYAVAGEIAAIADSIEAGMTPAQIEQMSAYTSQELDLLISFEPGVKFDDLDEPVYKSIVAETMHNALDTQVHRPHNIAVDMKEKWVDIAVGLKNGVLHVSVPQRRLFSSASYIFLVWMIAVSILLLGIAIIFMRNQIRPIRRLAIVAERFGRGLDAPVGFRPEGAHEVRQAAQAFIEMQERIKRQIQQRTAMLAGVSHDLRTPLTRMRLQIALLGDSPDADALKTDIADMERMINAYLDFARGQGNEPAASTDLKELLERVITATRRQGAIIELDAETGLYLQLRPVAFERCLSNLVNNARKYGTHIWVEARRSGGTVQIVIDDNGPGIPPDQYEEVFKPFVRGEPSRNPETGGVGLGLPIAQDIVAGHGGRIALEKSPHGGLRVVLEMPGYRPADSHT
jgi:two-component system osmolarity sensor histidine kinase EnvZ